jgi:hypothetical protein
MNLEGSSGDEGKKRASTRRDIVLRAALLAATLGMALVPNTASAVDPLNPHQPSMLPAVQNPGRLSDPVPHLSPRVPAVQNPRLPAVQSVRPPAVQMRMLPAVQMRIK